MSEPSSEPVRHIPWGYGVTRLTAMPVDPERLYAYWEITDADLDRARRTLPGSVEARLVLRIFDTTGRIFDGTNAHGSFDVAIQRSDRQWFLNLNRPHSSAVVEVGLVGAQGAYVALARSRPVDFPRREPAPPSEPEWRIAEEIVEVERVPRIELRSPHSAARPRSSAPALRATARPDAALPEGSSGGASEERLSDRGERGGASEARLRNNGRTRAS